ncbi:DUF2218 domain-containing protein [Octadecabacter sp. CECT 8868]|uniref:DUF2218 domain-containing protein n=1 Tax=Octadecabacter algicola TaxID=2909342 RepID=UPI001F370CC7|nr:DUF2218 domain-containing protein [Octadecabacter algicola]MCF2904974.1 DUF2218 domain-containing protein [Octadecabacter algicola]
MITSTANVTTERASTYLQQLSKHFGHKAEVRFDPQSGQIKFPFGQCELKANDTTLALIITAQSQANLTKAERVIASHLERFAFRENPEITWRPFADT